MTAGSRGFVECETMYCDNPSWRAAVRKGSVQPGLPKEKRDAMAHLAMGHVFRVTLQFRERFWAGFKPTTESLGNMAFLFSRQGWFPTWWTTMPRKLPLLTAWAPFPAAERLAGRPKEFIVEKAVDSLSRLIGEPGDNLKQLLVDAYWHDWQSDPFSRGAYSYVCVGGDRAEETMGTPLEGTLFFAGEATDISGHNGTVHGAIASGLRAAKEILESSTK